MVAWTPLRHLEDAEQVLEPVVTYKRIAFHIEEEVLRRRRGERLEAEALAERRQHLKRKRVALPLEHLQPGLLAKAGERHLVDALDRLVDRAGAELGDGLDT